VSTPARDALARSAAILSAMSLLASSVDRGRIAALRLTTQRLGGTRSASPADAVRWRLAVQAQELPGAKRSLGLRTNGCTETAVNAALDAGGASEARERQARAGTTGRCRP